MSKSTLVLLGSFLLSTVPANAQNPFCTNAVYKVLASGVAGFAPASWYCYSKFPLPIATRTNTAATTTVTTTVATNTQTTTVSTETDTIATETTTVATITNIVQTATITEQTTTTETTTTGLMNKRFAPRAATTKPAKEVAWSSLVAQANSIVGQVCTCLETQATSTVTTTPTAMATATASETQSVTQTTFVTLTVRTMATEDSTTTQTTTSVSTVVTAVCAPTFTRAVQASNGQQFRVQDNRFFCGGTYGSAGNTIYQVSAQQCYDACANNGNCAGFTYSPNYRYCELKSPGTFCYCPSSDFIAGIKA